MLYSLKKETGHVRPKDKRTNKKLWDNDNTHALSLTHTLLWKTHLHLSHFPIIHNNNKMDKEFLVQMIQSDKCGSVWNHEILNLHMGYGLGPSVSIYCVLQDTSHIYWLDPSKQSTRKKERTQKRDSAPNKSYRTGLVFVNRTQS